MAEGKFGTVITCMDGRVQVPVNNWMREKYGLDYIDTITEAGPDGIMARRDPDFMPNIKARVLISIEKHGSDTIALVAHGDCAGNPVSEAEHFGHLRKGMEAIRSWELPVDIVGLWLDEKTWKVDVVAIIER